MGYIMSTIAEFIDTLEDKIEKLLQKWRFRKK
jgi:hypothetical protein